MMRTNPTTKAAGRSRRPWRARLAAATVGGLVLTGTAVVGALPAHAADPVVKADPKIAFINTPAATISAPTTSPVHLRAAVSSTAQLRGKFTITFFKPAGAGNPGCTGPVAKTESVLPVATPVVPIDPDNPGATAYPKYVAASLYYSINKNDPAGYWQWRADYAGDVDNNAVSTGCQGTAFVQQRGGTTDPDPDPTDPTPTATRALVTRQFRDFLDRAPLSAELNDWSRRIEEKTATIGDLVASLRGGTDHLQNVDPVVRLYRAYFLRSPDAAGLEYWIDARRDGRSLTSISDFFSQSPEFRTRYGSLDNSAFVDLIYRNILTRPGDERGAAFWKGELDQGLRTRGAVMIGFSESPEYIADQASEVTVSVLYALMLDRAPTSVEFSGTVALLDITDTPRPFTVADLADDLAGKAEY